MVENHVTLTFVSPTHRKFVWSEYIKGTVGKMGKNGRIQEASQFIL